MGVGKTTVARILARRWRWRWLDLDRQIEAEQGQPPAALIAARGEPAFRALEAAALEAALAAAQPRIIATGGGTMAREAAWQAVAGRARTVHLTARLETLVARLSPRARARRPLWQGDMDALAKLWAERQIWYARADLAEPTDGASPAQVAERLAHRLMGPPL